MLYLDTSLLVSALSHEAFSAMSRTWMSEQKPELLAISDWTSTEVSSALALKVRTGVLTLEQRASALAVFHRLTSDSLATLIVSHKNFRDAAHFVDRHELGLRAGDALHVAIAAEHGATLCTLDQRMAKAGTSLGVPTILVA